LIISYELLIINILSAFGGQTLFSDRRRRIMDILALFGLIIGLGAIVAGNIAEGGTTAHLVQLAAALVVFGGTFGATVLSYPLSDLRSALAALKLVFNRDRTDPATIVEDSVNILVQARRSGLVALQPQIKEIENVFLRKGLMHVVDGMPPKMIKDILEQEIASYEKRMRRAARVFESAGGYAPTIGILGAVLGLIQVMSNVAEPSKIGAGISVAFVATIYGVGSANLVLFPFSKRILARMNEQIFLMELALEGILGVESGINPFFLRTKLNALLLEKDWE
jgi:chemotaxis protein MotA